MERFTLQVPLRLDIGEAFKVGYSMGYDGCTWNVIAIDGLELTIRRRVEASDRYDYLIGWETRKVKLEPTA